MNEYPCCGLEARRRAVRGCIAEPAFGYVLEKFQVGWRSFPQAFTRYLAEWNPYLSSRSINFIIAVCTDDPWPDGKLDGLRAHYPVVTLDTARLRELLREAERILEARLPDARPHLMAFLALHEDLRCAGPTREVATAWALQFARDQLLKAELTQHYLTEPDQWDDQPDPAGTLVRI